MASPTNAHFRLANEDGPDHVGDILAGRFGYRAEPPLTESWTFYDTFDWRLFNRSLVLRKRGDRLSLDSLSQDESVARQTEKNAPEFAWDLPESRLRSRLAPLIKMRALVPRVHVEVASIVYRVLNADEKTVARLVYTEVCTPEAEGEPKAVAYVSLQPVRGYVKVARKLANFLAELPQVDSLLQEIYRGALVQVGTQPASYSGSLAIRLKPDQRADSAAIEILRHLYGVMKANEPGIRADIDTEFLHDYRIAVRRTRSALSQIRNVFPEDRTEHFKQSFRYLGRLTNNLRDLDVYLLSEKEFRANLPEGLQDDIAPLFGYLRTLRASALDEVRAGLSSGNYERVTGEWAAFLDEPLPEEPGAANASLPIIVLARRRIYKHYRRVLKEGDYILTHTEDQLLHALRIECKKLRYLMEFFVSLFPRKRMKRLLEQVKKLQDNLGEFNDLAVQQAYLMHVAEELPIDDLQSRKALVAIGYLVEGMERRQEEVRAEFANTFIAFASSANQASFRRLFSNKGKKADG